MLNCDARSGFVTHATAAPTGEAGAYAPASARKRRSKKKKRKGAAHEAEATVHADNVYDPLSKAAIDDDGCGSIPLHREFAESEFRGTSRFAWAWIAKLEDMFPDRMCAPFRCQPRHHAMWVEPDYDGTMRVDATPRLLDRVRNECFTGDSKKQFTGWVVVFRSGKGEVHGNGMLYDRFNEVLVRFEPRGKGTSGYDAPALDRAIYDWLAVEFPGSMYVAPDAFQRPVGPQTKEVLHAVHGRHSLPSHGPCVIWSLMFMHLKIQHPHMGYDQIADALGDYGLVTSLAMMYGHIIANEMTELPKCRF